MSAPKPVYGRSGMVVSAHPLATLVGREILSAGGTVADAAIAAAAVMAVVLPQACTIGGDAFTLIHEANGKTIGLNGSGPSPASAIFDRFGNGVPYQGPLSCTVPGVLASWFEIHNKYGRLKWSRLLDRAVEYAENGFPISLGVAQSIVAHRALLEQSDAASALFLPNGKPLVAGDVLKQPALARTLSSIRDKGIDTFYAGKTPAEIAGEVQSRGGILASDDFAKVRVDWVAPIETVYRGRTVRVMPPNSFGLLLLLQLNALSGADTKGWDLTQPARLVTLIQNARKVFAEAEDVVADPAYVDEAVIAALLSSQTEANHGSSVAPISNASNKGGTAIVSVADSEGNAITIVQSIFALFGSGILDGNTGVLLNNRLSGFNNRPGHPNAVAPGKRPAHTLNPCMVFEGDRLRYLIATPGGPGQTITLTQVLSNMFDLGLDPGTAIDMPRWSLEIGGKAIVEPTMPKHVVEAAEKEVGPLEVASPNTSFFGSTELIEFLPSRALSGVADHRREALALGV